MREISGGTPKYKFLFETISFCILHMNLDSPYGLDESSLTEFVDPAENELFFSSPEQISRMLYFARKTRSMTSLTNALLHYAGNDP